LPLVGLNHHHQAIGNIELEQEQEEEEKEEVPTTLDSYFVERTQLPREVPLFDRIPC
jgi:hypothetical protein